MLLIHIGPLQKDMNMCVCVCAWEKGREKREREARIHMHVCARKRVYIYVCVYIYIYIYICACVCVCVCVSVCTIYLPTYLPIYLSIYRSIDLSIYRSIHPSIHPSIHASIHPCIHPSIHPSILSICLCVCVFAYQPTTGMIIAWYSKSNSWILSAFYCHTEIPQSTLWICHSQHWTPGKRTALGQFGESRALTQIIEITENRKTLFPPKKKINIFATTLQLKSLPLFFRVSFCASKLLKWLRMNPCKYCSYHALLGSQDSDADNVLVKEVRKDNKPD